MPISIASSAGRTCCSALAAALVLIAVHVCAAKAQRLYPVRVLDLNSMRGNRFPNLLGLQDIAVDESRGLAYAVSSTRCAVVDMSAALTIASFPLPGDGACEYRILGINSTSATLLLRRSDEPHRLLGVNVINGSTTASFDSPSNMPIAGAAADLAGNRVFVTDGTPVIRVLDGTSLRQNDIIETAVSMPAGALAYDSARGQVVVLSKTRISGRVHAQIFNGKRPYQLFRGLSWGSEEDCDAVLLDAREGSMALTGGTLGKVIGPAGLEQGSFTIPGGISSASLNASDGILYLADRSAHLRAGPSGKHGLIHSVRIATLERDSMKAGNRIERLAADGRGGCVAMNSIRDNKIILFHPKSGDIREVDAGESADCLAWDPVRREIHVSDALGDGDGISSVRLPREEFSVHRGGAWPVAMGFDEHLRRLTVFDHLDATMTFFDFKDTLSAVTLVLPGLPEARTDDLSHMAYDASAHLALICIPEHSRWLIVDAARPAVLKEGAVDGHSFRPTGEAGQLQGAILTSLNRFFVLRAQEKMLNVYGLSDGALLREIDLAGLDWERVARAGEDALFADPQSGRLFVGPYLFNAESPETPAATLPDAFRCLGISREGARIIGLATAKDSLRFTVHAASDLRVLISGSLYPAGLGTSASFFDPLTARLFLAERKNALLREYSMSLLLPAGPPPGQPGHTALTAHPNPAPAVSGIRVTLNPGDGRSAGGACEWLISDETGRIVASSAVTEDAVTAGFAIETAGLASGAYRLLLLYRGRIFTASFVIR